MVGHPKIYVVRLGGDDPKMSTALKLVRLGYAEKILPSSLPTRSLILNPYSSRVFSPMDSVSLLRSGLVVLDASWNSGLESLKKLARARAYEQRVLPALKAGNPINFGILTKLSSAEAVAAALYIAGFKDFALEILSKFKWGPTFYDLNKDYLERYSKATSSDEVLAIQKEILKTHGIV